MTINKTVYLYVFNGMADWEPGYAVAELNSGRYFKKDSQRYTVKALGLNQEPVVTMGGLRIIPDISLEKYTVENTAALIFPGGDTWLNNKGRWQDVKIINYESVSGFTF